MPDPIDRFRVATTRTLFIAFLLAAPNGATTATDPTTATSGSPTQGEFEAQWSVEGTQEELSFGSVGQQAIFRHKGRVTVLRSDGLVGNALSSCIGLSDSRKGTTSRCVWVTDGGAEIFSEVRRAAAPAGHSGEGEGRIVGGTGRFAGIEGRFDLRWIERPQPKTTEIAGETVSMKGRWRIR